MSRSDLPSELEFLIELETVIRSRLRDVPEGSYTATLAAAGTQRVAQKVGEEAVELAIAAVAGDRDGLRDEAADLLFHLLLLLAVEDSQLADVVRILRERHAN